VGTRNASETHLFAIAKAIKLESLRTNHHSLDDLIDALECNGERETVVAIMGALSKREDMNASCLIENGLKILGFTNA
jgi:hypothetical protein